MKILYKLILIILFFSVSFLSCEKFLTEKNQSGLTADPFYYTLEGITALENSCYSGMRVWFGKEPSVSMCESGTDLFTYGGDGKTIASQNYGVELNGSLTYIDQMWSGLYKSVNICNTALKYLPSDKLSTDINTQYIGEVSLLRALYLWIITETWGNVVLYTEPTEGVVNTAQRSSVDEFYKVIFSDLDVAIANLPAKKSTDGRLTQDAAKAFKARMCLTRASATNDVAMYAKAATLAKEVIATNRYSLFSNYKLLWDMSNNDGAKNPEAIFWVNYETNNLLNPDFDPGSLGYAGNNLHMEFLMIYDKELGMTRAVQYGRPFQRFRPTVHFLDLFNEDIDQRFYGALITSYQANKTGLKAGDIAQYPKMAFGDTAIFLTKKVATPAQREWAKDRYVIYDRNDMYYADGGIKRRSQFIGLNKFVDPTRAGMNDGFSGRDYWIIRISEMYLIAAEALMKTNPAEAVSYINALRTKRAIPGKETQMQVSQSDLNIDFILEERARELCGEHIRWYDLKRTGKLIEYVQAYNPDAKNNIKDFHSIRPIPQSQLDAVFNKDEFKQNPGYN